MTFLPLTLGIRKTTDAEGGVKKAPTATQLKDQSTKTLKRDDYTCRFCGFRSTQYQRTIPFTVKGNDLPFVTACTFCEQCVFLDRAGAMGSGQLIWLPEMTQIELNHLARSLYIARAKLPESATDPKKADPEAEVAMPNDHSHDMVAAANRAHTALMSRRSDAKRRLGSDDPMSLATIMHESLSDDDLKNLSGKLDGVRLMPLEKYLVRTARGDVNQFPKMVQFWRSEAGPYGKMPPDKWPELLRGAMAGDSHA